MKTMRFYTLLALLLFGANAFAQEWEHIHEFAYSDTAIFTYNDCYELHDGSILVSSLFYYKSGYGDFYSPQPALMTLSSGGRLLAQTDFYRPGYCGYNPYIVEDEQGDVYALMAYNPDHDFSYFNYFKNYDNPTDHSILALYKLDNSLSIEECYENEIVIDTFEYRDSDWEMFPNEKSGNLYLFSVMVDEGTIVGAYTQSVSYDHNLGQRGKDSTFFFRMGFDGEIINRVGYELPASNSMHSYFLRRNHLVKDGDKFLYYSVGIGAEFSESRTKGTVAYLDENFQYLGTRDIYHVASQYPDKSFYNISVKRSGHQTTYVACNMTYEFDSDCRIYEFDDRFDILESHADAIPVLRYAERRSGNYDAVATVRSVDLLDDDCVVFCYTLNLGFNFNLDSWMMIECLNLELDTLSTVFYDILSNEDLRINSRAYSVLGTSDGGIVLISNSRNLDDSNQRWSTVTKFPTQAFWSIDEAHDDGLKVAIAYPNPGKDVLNIRTGLKDARVEVYDMSGRMVYGQEITENVTSINAEGWPAGAYVWKVFVGTSTGSVIEAESGKWIKQ